MIHRPGLLSAIHWCKKSGDFANGSQALRNREKRRRSKYMVPLNIPRGDSQCGLLYKRVTSGVFEFFGFHAAPAIIVAKSMADFPAPMTNVCLDVESAVRIEGSPTSAEWYTFGPKLDQLLATGGRLASSYIPLHMTRYLKLFAKPCLLKRPCIIHLFDSLFHLTFSTNELN